MPQLKGYFFHSFTKDGAIKWQGEVKGVSKDGQYLLVDLFEWVCGEHNLSKLIPILETTSWNFYETSGMMNDYYRAHLPQGE